MSELAFLLQKGNGKLGLWCWQPAPACRLGCEEVEAAHLSLTKPSLLDVSGCVDWVVIE